MARAIAKKVGGDVGIARVISEPVPESPFGFIHTAYALHEMQGVVRPAGLPTKPILGAPTAKHSHVVNDDL